jgi:methanogenic corrinoid protein MtbC1
MVKNGINFVELEKQFTSALLSVDRLTVKEILTQPGLASSPYELVEKLVVPVLESIGRGWETGQYSLSQVYMSGKICEDMVDLIMPPLDKMRRSQPKMAIVVLQDYHLLGKRIVYSLMRASGFELENFGRMDVDGLVKRVQQDKIEILLISVLMLPSALSIKKVREQLEQAGYPLKIVVGGAPFRFDQELWREVGADAMGTSASEAVEIINRIVEERL